MHKQTNAAAFFRALALFAAALSGAQLYAQSVSELPRIAHAGGQIGNATYTNSIDALELNYDAGFRVFEMDFSFTSDQQLVCLHDWEESFERSFGLPARPAVSLLVFEQLVRDRSEYNKCTLASLMQWFSTHPQAILVTDVKERNLEALAVISSKYPQLIDRVIPQIYHPDEYSPTRDLGYKRIIWTLYLYPGSASTVLSNAQTMDLWAITMDTNRANQGLGLDLDAIAIPSYVHTINDYADYLYFKSAGVDEIYTDNLSPSRERALQNQARIKISDSNYYKARENRSRELVRKKVQFFDKPKLLYSLEDDFSPSSVSVNQIDQLVFSSGAAAFVATGSDPFLNFPALAEPATEIEIYLHINLPEASQLEVFYATEAQPDYSQSMKAAENGLRGSNEFVIRISSASPITRIRLDPGAVPGKYRIERLEIRSN